MKQKSFDKLQMAASKETALIAVHAIDQKKKGNSDAYFSALRSNTINASFNSATIFCYWISENLDHDEKTIIEIFRDLSQESESIETQRAIVIFMASLLEDKKLKVN